MKVFTHTVEHEIKAPDDATHWDGDWERPTFYKCTNVNGPTWWWKTEYTPEWKMKGIHKPDYIVEIPK